MAPRTNEIITQVNDQVTAFEAKALELVADAQAPVVEYVGKAAEALAARLPEDRPAALAGGISVLVDRVDFAKRVLDVQVDFVKSLLDAAVKPVKPARKATKTVKAA